MSEVGEWIVHGGGPCPVPGDDFVGVRFRDGVEISPGVVPARLWASPKDWWQHERADETDIVAYCVVQP